MKIYFAGSIRGGREDRELYLHLIQHLQKYGEVLTEHIGDKDITASGEENLPDKFIHDRDLGWLLESNVVVAEISTTSLGVGYEIGRAVEHQKPLLCLYRAEIGKRLSPMISGCTEITTIPYQNLEEAKRSIDDFFKKIKNNLPHRMLIL